MLGDYSSATLELPVGYFVTHLQQMGALTERFPGLEILQGTVEKVRVTGDTAEAREVAQWVTQFLGPMR